MKRIIPLLEVEIENGTSYVIQLLNDTKFRGTVRVNDIKDGVEAIVLEGNVKIIKEDKSELVYGTGKRFRLNDGDAFYVDNIESCKVMYLI